MMKGTFRAEGAPGFCLNARADVAERLTPRRTNAQDGRSKRVERDSASTTHVLGS